MKALTRRDQEARGASADASAGPGRQVARPEGGPHAPARRRWPAIFHPHPEGSLRTGATVAMTEVFTEIPGACGPEGLLPGPSGVYHSATGPRPQVTPRLLRREIRAPRWRRIRSARRFDRGPQAMPCHEAMRAVIRWSCWSGEARVEKRNGDHRLHHPFSYLSRPVDPHVDPPLRRSGEPHESTVPVAHLLPHPWFLRRAHSRLLRRGPAQGPPVRLSRRRPLLLSALPARPGGVGRTADGRSGSPRRTPACRFWAIRPRRCSIPAS